MDGTNVGETKQTVGGLSGLFSDSDASLAMKLVLFSGNPEVQEMMANVPFVAIGAVAMSFAVVLVMIGRLNRGLVNLILAGAFALAGAILSLANIIMNEWTNQTNFGLTIALSVAFAISAGFRAWYVFRRAEQPGRRERPVPEPATTSDPYPSESRFSWSSRSSRARLHSGQWGRYGFFGLLIRAVLYMTVATVVALQITWRIAFSSNAEPFIGVYYASAVLEIFFLAAISVHFLSSCFSSRQPMPTGSNILWISPILFGNAVGVAVATLNLPMINFSETPLGRLLTALQLFVYFTNSLIDELRSPSPDIFTAEPYPRSIVPSFYGDGSVRSSQFDSDVKTPPDASGQFARPVGGASPTWDNSSVASSQQWLAIDTSTVPGRDVEDSPVDKEVETAPMVGRQRSLYQPRRPGMLHVSETQPADSVERDMFEAPASGSSLPSYQTDAFSGSRSTSESKNQDDSMRRLRSTTLTQSLRVLPPIRQASHESSADQSVYSAEQERRFHYSMSSGSDSSSSTSPMSGMQSTRFPMPPESPRTNPPNSVLVDDEPFVFEPPRAGRFEQKFQQRDSELTLGSAGSIGESLPESAGAPPTPSSQAAARNITSFIAPGSSGNHAAPAMAAVAVQGTAPLAPSRDSTASSYAEAPNAQILKAQSVIRDHYARNALPQR